MSTRKMLALLLLFGCSVMSLWLRGGFPVVAFGYYAHDDALFVAWARRILTGEWLGPYQQLTLAKGPIFSLFVALVAAVGVPLKLAEQAVYLAASGLLAWVVGRMSRRLWLGALMFLLLSLNPFMFAAGMARVIREGLYVGLTVAVFALVTITLRIASDSSRRARNRVGLVTAVAAGGCIGVFWLTREEGLWLLPSLTVLVLGAIGVPNALHPGTSQGRRAIAILGFASVSGLFAWICYLLLASLNFRVYGVFLTNDFNAGSFPSAYGALARILPKSRDLMVPISVDARRKAYGVSPAAAALEPILDDPEWKHHPGWRVGSCLYAGNAACPDIMGGWFAWALRDAVATRGQYKSATAAQAFYAQLASEINAACDEARIDCLERRDTLLPRLRIEHFARLLGAVGDGLEMLIGMRGLRIERWPSVGSVWELAQFSDTVGPIAPAAGHASVQLTGELFGSIDGATIKLTDKQTFAEWLSAPRNAASETSAQAKTRAHFNLTGRCHLFECYGLLVSPDGTAHIFDAHKIRAGDVLEAGSVKVRFESVVQPTLPWTGAIAHARAKLQLMIVSTLQKAFAALLPPGFVLALAGTVIGLVAGRRHDASLYWIGVLALASLVGVLSRLLLLALIDATSFPAVFPWYLSAASPLALAFVVLGVSAGVIGWLRRGESSTKGVSEE